MTTNRELEEYLKLTDTGKAFIEQQSDDCVSRADLLKIYENRFIELQKAHQIDKQLGVNWCVNTLKDMPPVTPTRKIGKWIRVDHTKVKCSNCDITHLIAQYPHGVIDYCPNCGSYNQSIIENER